MSSEPKITLSSEHVNYDWLTESEPRLDIFLKEILNQLDDHKLVDRFLGVHRISFQLMTSPYMLLFTDLSTYILKRCIFDDKQHYFCIQVIYKMPQKQRTNSCFSFKNQVTPVCILVHENPPRRTRWHFYPLKGWAPDTQTAVMAMFISFGFQFQVRQTFSALKVYKILLKQR